MGCAKLPYHTPQIVQTPEKHKRGEKALAEARSGGPYARRPIARNSVACPPRTSSYAACRLPPDCRATGRAQSRADAHGQLLPHDRIADCANLRGSWRLTARTNTLARNERKRHGMRQASPSAPAQRNEAKERQRLVTTTVKGKRSVRAQCVTTHLIPSPLAANLHARPRVLDRNAGGCAHCTRRREDDPG